MPAFSSDSEIPTPLSLLPYYRALFAAHGPQHWWPGRTPFEIIVGAILVQNTSWTNVATSIDNLRREKLLTPAAIEKISTPRLQRLIRSSGYFRQKTKKLKAFTRFLRHNYQGSLSRMLATPAIELRRQLLSIHGIGPETADSILLYAAGHPVFVVDAYARRILERHHLATPGMSYESVRLFIEASLPSDPALYNELHALIVHTGKHFCRPRQPRCAACPLQSLLPVAAVGLPNVVPNDSLKVLPNDLPNTLPNNLSNRLASNSSDHLPNASSFPAPRSTPNRSPSLSLERIAAAT
jgi:endonuclease-3 related protein